MRTGRRAALRIRLKQSGPLLAQPQKQFLPSSANTIQAANTNDHFRHGEIIPSRHTMAVVRYQWRCTRNSHGLDSRNWLTTIAAILLPKELPRVYSKTRVPKITRPSWPHNTNTASNCRTGEGHRRSRPPSVHLQSVDRIGGNSHRQEKNKVRIICCCSSNTTNVCARPLVVIVISPR